MTQQYFCEESITVGQNIVPPGGFTKPAPVQQRIDDLAAMGATSIQAQLDRVWAAGQTSTYRITYKIGNPPPGPGRNEWLAD